MKAAYVDTSLLLAIVFDEPGASTLLRSLSRYEQAFSSDLLTAETLSAAARERLDVAAVTHALDTVALVLPHRSLDREVQEVLGHGYIRGADVWHLACAVFLADGARSELAFLSRDVAQRRIARRLGFNAP